MTPKQKMAVVLPIVAALVIAFVYFGLFTNPYVIIVVFAAWLIVTIRNRRKFGRQQDVEDGGSAEKVSVLRPVP